MTSKTQKIKTSATRRLKNGAIYNLLESLSVGGCPSIKAAAYWADMSAVQARVIIHFNRHLFKITKNGRFSEIRLSAKGRAKLTKGWEALK